MRQETDFRALAERERMAAREADLPNVRRIHLDAAEKFDLLADDADRRRLRRHPAYSQDIFY